MIYRLYLAILLLHLFALIAIYGSIAIPHVVEKAYNSPVILLIEYVGMIPGKTMVLCGLLVIMFRGKKKVDFFKIVALFWVTIYMFNWIDLLPEYTYPLWLGLLIMTRIFAIHAVYEAIT